MLNVLFASHRKDGWMNCTYLSAKGLEVPSVEILGQYPLRKGIGGKEHQQSTTPFNDAGMLFSYQHVVQPCHELVESRVTPATRVLGIPLAAFLPCCRDAPGIAIAVGTSLSFGRRIWIWSHGDRCQLQAG